MPDEEPIIANQLPVDPDEADRVTDRGPDGLRQRRLPAAGFVRYIENPTPTFALPPQRGAQGRMIECRYCRRVFWQERYSMQDACERHR